MLGRLILLLISSGSLIPMEAMNDIGYLDGSLFIDLVDTEWYLRAIAKGYQSYGVCDAIMNHALGDKVIRIWFGRMRTVPIHSPLRLYYIFRNSVLVSTRPYVSRKWIIDHCLKLVQRIILFPCLVAPRRKYILMILRGLRDGILGRTGKYRG